MVQYKVLYHHGIKGQKWGKKNGPPYPLDEKDKSAKEKEEQKKSRINWKKVAIGAGITVGAALATYGAYRLAKSGKFKELGKQKITDLAGEAFIESSSNANAKYNSNQSKSPLTETLKHAFDAKEINESVSERLEKSNQLRDRERINSCVQSSLANAFSKITGLGFKAKADLDENGTGRRHLLGGVAEECFPEVREGGKLRRNLREYANASFITSREKTDSQLKEWFGDNAEGLICTNLFSEKDNKVFYSGHCFNFSIKDGIVSYEDSKDHIERTDFFQRTRERLSNFSALRMDNLTQVDVEQISKYMEAR